MTMQRNDHVTDPTSTRTAPEVPEAMRLIHQDTYGLPDVLSTRTGPTPDVKPDTVLVEVKAASVNPLDWHFMTGTPWLVRLQGGIRRPKRTTPGVDVAGRVVAVGAEVEDFSVGDEVMGMCAGTFAEYVAATEQDLVAKPAGVTFDEAAGCGVAGLTALQGLRDKVTVKPGTRVVINGASGGVGTAAIQIAKTMGAHVTAVCSDRNADLVRSLGADAVVDYANEDFTELDAFDVLFDNQGNRSVSDCRRALTPTGTLLIVGGPKNNRVVGPMGRMAAILLRFRFTSQKASAFIASIRHSDLAELASMMEAGDLRTVVDATFDLEHAADAMDVWSRGHVRGKLIINP